MDMQEARDKRYLHSVSNIKCSRVKCEFHSNEKGVKPCYWCLSKDKEVMDSYRKQLDKAFSKLGNINF